MQTINGFFILPTKRIKDLSTPTMPAVSHGLTVTAVNKNIDDRSRRMP
jgi:hypothetical protein